MKARLLVAGAALVAIALAVTLFVLRSGSEEEAPVLRSAISTGAAFEPQAHLFGERISARLEILYDTARIRPESIRASPRLAPYRIVSRSEERERVGGMGRVRYEFELDCLTRRCLVPKGNVFTFSQTGVEYRPHGVDEPLIASVQWPPVRVASRIGGGDLEGLEMQADVRDLPAVTYRIQPGTVTALGYGLAVLLGVLGLAVLARALSLPALVSAALARRRDRLSPLRRALTLVRDATEKGEEAESRRALERLAVELRETREPDLARAATRLAWRRSDPSTPMLEPLSGEVERVIAEEAR